MEKGYYSPSRGYWQTTGTPSDAILATYPADTVEVSLRPDGEGWYWDGTDWAYLEPDVTGDKVDYERDQRTLAGSTFTVTGYATPIRIEGDETTQRFLQALGTEATLLIMSQQTGSFVWRDADNVNHTLTEAQMSELYVVGGAWIKAVRAAAWTLKDTPGGIPADYADDSYWP